jgi:hypothetical protein
MKIILLLSLLVLCTSKNYTCLDSSIVKDETICRYETLDTIYLRPCPIGQKCKEKVKDEESYNTCETFSTKKYHGEYCDLSAECWSNNCTDNECTGKVDNQPCKEDYECGKESYCKKHDKICTPYVLKEGDCTDLECAFGYECVNIGGGVKQCREQYSVKIGERAEHESLCESGISKDKICYNTRMKNNEQEFKQCQIDEDCVIEIIHKNGTVVKEDTTRCKVKGPNGMHCEPTTSSKQWQNYVKAFKEVRDSISKNKVHPSLIMDDEEIYSPVLREARLKLEYYNMKDCVLDNLSVLVGSGFIKVSFTLIALLLFTIIA